MQPRIGFVGAGKVGHVLARLWKQAGYEISAVTSRTEAHAQTLAAAVGADVVKTAAEVVARSDVTLLTVNDDAITEVAEQITAANPDLSGKGIVHTSGAKSLDVLAGLQAGGARLGSLHPVFPFAEVETALQRLPGATFAVEADDDGLQSWLTALVTAVNGRVMLIPPGDKVLYHAALVIASNYTVVLFHVAEQLLHEMVASQQAAHNALSVLLEGTVANLKANSTAEALTGPLVRGDMGTVAAHLEALAAYPQVRDLYRLLTEAALPMLEQRDMDEETLALIKRQLGIEGQRETQG